MTKQQNFTHEEIKALEKANKIITKRLGLSSVDLDYIIARDMEEKK